MFTTSNVATSGRPRGRSWHTEDLNPDPHAVGLCLDCEHSRIIRSDRGSIFYLCKLSAADSRFAKYPRLPVLSCSGYEKKKPDSGYEDIRP